MTTSQDFFNDLQWRGLVHQCTATDELREALSAAPVTLYCGFDPTAHSLHVGSLIPLVTLARFQQAGHRVLALVGGATGLIGDPSGKSAERVLQSAQDVADRAVSLSRQISRFVSLEDAARGKLVNNLDWTGPVSVLEFLRDVGKNFSVNAMISRDSVKSRLEREEGISFTEFSYMLLQAFDFLKLHEREGCTLQIGGSDQWGNMCSGVDLVRRVHGQAAFALTLPLLTTADGQKFGKTAKGAVWLDSGLTSVWDFYQFWLNTEDVDVVRLLKLFTFLSREEIEGLEQLVQHAPQDRAAQKALAFEMTCLVHGKEKAEQMVEVAGVLFGKASVQTLSTGAWDQLTGTLPCTSLLTLGDDLRLARVLVALGLEPSLSRANEALRSGAVQVNGAKVDVGQSLDSISPLKEVYWLFRKGKKSFGLVRA